MGLQALKIIEEEIARCRRTLDDGTPAPAFSAAGVSDRLDSLEARIRDRILKECIEQPDPDEVPECHLPACTNDAVQEGWAGSGIMRLVPLCGDHKYLHKGDPNHAAMRDHIRKGGDPADFNPND